jgi:peptide deformylase
MAVREILKMGDPRLLRVARPVPPSTRPSCTRWWPTCSTPWRRRGRRAGGAADRRRPAGGDLRLHHNERYPDRRRCRHGAGQPADRAAGDEWSRAGRAACRCPGCAAWCRAMRASATAASTPQGEAIDREAEGFHARVVQHECDHLIGRLYPTRMTDLTSWASPACCFRNWTAEPTTERLYRACRLQRRSAAGGHRRVAQGHRRHHQGPAPWSAPPRPRWRLLGLLLLALAAAGLAAAQDEADPPGRVGRVADLAGGVVVRPRRGALDRAERNRPLTTGTAVDRPRRARRTAHRLDHADAGRRHRARVLRLDDEQLRMQCTAAAWRCACARAKWPRETRSAPTRPGCSRCAAACTAWTATTTPRRPPAGAASCASTDDPSLTVDRGRRLQIWREGPPARTAPPLARSARRRLCAAGAAADRDDDRSAATAMCRPR